MTMTAWDATAQGATGILEAPAPPEATQNARAASPTDDAPSQRPATVGARSTRTLDLLGALTLGALTLPLMLVIALALKLESRGPIFFIQQRPGIHGRPFFILKFRTMCNRTSPRAAADQSFEKCPHDPRITRIGRLLRRTSLDELPQLWNVIRGDLSLVGPRPYLYEQIEDIGDRLNEIQRVRPGLTGLWQVSGRSDLSLRRRIACDLYYVQNQSLAMDLAILARTVTAVLSTRGAY